MKNFDEDSLGVNGWEPLFLWSTLALVIIFFLAMIFFGDGVKS